MDLRLGLHRPAPARRSCCLPHGTRLWRGLRPDRPCNAHRELSAFVPGLRSPGGSGPSYRSGSSATLQPAPHGGRGGPQDREADQGPGEREQQADHNAVSSHVVFPFSWRRPHRAVTRRWVSRRALGNTDLLFPKRQPPIGVDACCSDRDSELPLSKGPSCVPMSPEVANLA